MKAFFKKLTLWKLAWFRCVIYACIGGWTEFEHLTETWTQVTWNGTGPFELTRLFGHVFFTSMCVTIAAFLDQTISKGGNVIPPISSGNTEIFTNKSNEKTTPIPPIVGT